MSRWLRIAIISALTLFAAYVGLMWVGIGGLESFQPPFEIVVPDGVRGVVCATSRPGTAEDTNNVVRHEVTPSGLLEVNGDILRSHRPRKLFIRKASSSQLTEIPSNTLFSIYTENDTASGQWYSVMWLGSVDEWDSFREQSPNTLRCLNRFGKAVSD